MVDFVREVKTKKASVIMRTREVFTVFTTHIEANCFRVEVLTQPLHEFLEVGIEQRIVVRKVCVVIGKRNERIFLM